MFIMGVYPGAYVDIGEGINKLSPLSQLRMYLSHSLLLLLSPSLSPTLPPSFLSLPFFDELDTAEELGTMQS
jgi:hypothetical protein